MTSKSPFPVSTLVELKPRYHNDWTRMKEVRFQDSGFSMKCFNVVQKSTFLSLNTNSFALNLIRLSPSLSLVICILDSESAGLPGAAARRWSWTVIVSLWCMLSTMQKVALPRYKSNLIDAYGRKSTSTNSSIWVRLKMLYIPSKC